MDKLEETKDKTKEIAPGAVGSFFGGAAFIIMTSYLHEHRHHPAGKPASHEAWLRRANN